MHQPDVISTGERNHPAALRMAIIAFVSFNVTIACIYGSFSVLLAAVEARLHVGQQLASLGIPAVSLSTALCAPFVGHLATRYSLRLILLIGSLLNVVAFLILAFTASFPLYLVAFGLFLGPGMAAGVILPGTLVTRWFAINRGKALGFVNTPLVIGILPLASTWMLLKHGLPGTYLLLAGLEAVTVVATLFIIDRPPGFAAGQAQAGVSAAGGWSMPQLLKSTRFWGLSFAFIASAVSSIVITVHMVPMAHSWGLTATMAASLLTAQSFIGIAGTNLFGWLVDRLGAVLTMALLVFDAGILWLILLVHPAFPEAMVLIGLIGLHGAGAPPVMSAALSEVFGQESFSRAYGLVQLIILPFSVLCVPAAALVYTRTGSYDGALIGAAAFLLLGGVLAGTARRRSLVPRRRHTTS